MFTFVRASRNYLCDITAFLYLLLCLGRGARYCDEHVSVCPSVGLCVREYVSGTQVQTSLNSLYMLPKAVDRSSADTVAMLCTSGFIDVVMFSYHHRTRRRDATAATLQRCRVRTDTPVAWCWLRAVRRRRTPRLDK